MQNILFLITKSEVGGAQKFVQEQIEVCKSEFKVYLCTNEEGWLVDVTRKDVAKAFLNKKIEHRNSFLYLYKLYKFIKKNNIDLVITNSANAGFYGRLAAFFAGKKSCYFSHGWSSVYNGGKISFLLNFIERLLAFISTKVICVSHNDYQIALNKIGVSQKKLITIKNAILPTYTKRNNLDITKLKVIALARFANPKRIDLMIQSFEQINNAELSIAGTGQDFEIWQQYIQENKINNIKLLGEVKSFSAFNEYDAFMLISNSEGLPISAIEAMSCGLPLILSNVGGCSELINNNGILVDNNIESIKTAIKKMSSNYHTYQKNTVSVYNDLFNLSNKKYEYIELYKNLIESI